MFTENGSFYNARVWTCNKCYKEVVAHFIGEFLYQCECGGVFELLYCCSKCGSYAIRDDDEDGRCFNCSGLSDSSTKLWWIGDKLVIAAHTKMSAMVRGTAILQRQVKIKPFNFPELIYVRKFYKIIYEG